MRLGSVFKMQMSILSTATTEQMGYRIFSFFVYIKSTDQNSFTESVVKSRTINILEIFPQVCYSNL